MRLLLDQGTSPGTPALLEGHGHEALHLTDCGMSGAEDPDILAFAKQQGRVLITYDKDFPNLLASSGDIEPSVILLRVQGLRRKEEADLIADVLIHANNDLVDGSMVSVNQRKIRVHPLPLPPSRR